MAKKGIPQRCSRCGLDEARYCSGCSGVTVLKKPCEFCATEFEAERDTARYCSDACRQAAYRDRRDSGYRTHH